MPAKTVVFTNTRKWDGVEYRILNAGEYIQMSGRAGRRGKDDRGLTIIMFPCHLLQGGPLPIINGVITPTIGRVNG